MSEEIKESSMQFLQEMADSTSIDIKLLENEYKKLHDALKEEESFQDPEHLERFIQRHIRAKYQSRSPAIPRKIIPVGMDQIRKNKDGDLYSSLFVIDETKKLRRVAFNGDICEQMRDIQMWYPYKDVPLAEYSKSNDFLADDRADFSNMLDSKLDPMKILSITNCKKLTLKDILTADERELRETILSRVDDRGWPIKSDWRAIHGKVENMKYSTDDKENTNSGWLRITDGSIPVSRELFDNEGNTISKDMRIWVSPLTAPNLTQYSEAWVLGTLGQNPNSKEITMNGFCIVPTFIWNLEG